MDLCSGGFMFPFPFLVPDSDLLYAVASAGSGAAAFHVCSRHDELDAAVTADLPSRVASLSLFHKLEEGEAVDLLTYEIFEVS